MITKIIVSLIAVFGIINIVRIGFFMIGSDLYTIKEALRDKKFRKIKNIYTPKFSIIIPAHNEETTILKTLNSVTNLNYPADKTQIIVVDDGSTDKTKELVDEFIKDIKNQEVILVTQENAGKAHALNNALVNYTKGELVMCLDADSTLDPNALQEAVLYFTDKKVVAMAANVKIRPSKGLLNFIQRYEYIISFQMRKALTIYNLEHIVGGGRFSV